MPTTSGIHHIALTVADLAVSVSFYTDLFGTGPAAGMSDGPFERKVFAVPGGGANLGLTEHDAGAGDRFDATRTGLDHVGFGVTDRAALDAWITHLDSLGITHSGVVEASYGSAVSFTDPDGIALELFSPAD